MPSQRVQFTARIISEGKGGTLRALDAGEFVYHVQSVNWLPRAHELTDEQLLLLSAEGGVLPALWQANSAAVLAEIRGEVELAGASSGQYTIELKPEWISKGHAVTVAGVLVDQNGREQRASKRITLKKDAKHAKRLVIELPRRMYLTGEPIRLSVHATGAGKLAAPVTVVAMRLSAGYASYPAAGQLQLLNSASRPYPQARAYARRWRHYQPARYVHEELVTAAVVRAGAATLKLTRPGAYRLVAIARLADGSEIRDRVGCLIRSRDELPVLILKLDESEYKAGGMLTGEIHCRYRDAKVLLTIRDSSGIRLWRAIRIHGSAAALNERLPRGFSYGCSVAAHYVDKDGRTHAAQKNVRVVPIDRMLDVRTEMKEICQPGEKAKIRIKVNRDEPVDLAVSVYDQSLLGIAPDRSANIRNFYLADERVFDEADMNLLSQKLGNLTVEELLPKIREFVKNNPRAPEAADLRTVLSRYKGRYLYEHQIAALMNFAGIRTRLAAGGYNWRCRLDGGKGAENKLADLIRRTHAKHLKLAFRHYDDLLVVGVVDSRNSRLVQYPYAYPGMPGAYAQRRSFARGDAEFSLSGNAFKSLSGQSFISHMPGPGVPPAMLEPEGGSGSIMVRRDFSDSAFWNARVRTDERGEATVEFKLPDSLTNWRVVVTAITKDMHVGQVSSGFRTYKPIMVWPMIPRTFTQGDRIRIFARVHNRTDRSRRIRVGLEVENGEVLGRKATTVIVPANDSQAVYWTFKPGRPGYTQILMTARCEDVPEPLTCRVGPSAWSDASLKRLPVVPACSVESTIAHSGFCEGKVDLDVPEDVELARARLEVTLTPSLLADMVDTLDYLVAYPHGCVEQTMSRFLPAIKVAGILKSSGIRQESLEQKLPRCVAGGIKRLLQLQHKDGGWGWNGSSATHEMMTPYALYGLLEAEKAGYALGNDQAVNRGLDCLERFIKAMGPKQAADRIYCMYVYANRREIREDWWKFLDAQLARRKLSDYATALALELAVRNEKKDLARRLAGALRKAARKVDGASGDVHWTTAGFSRWGNDPYEITAAAMKALVAYDANDPMIPRILSYFARTKRGNRWNSTKSTAMVLFAMCDYLARKDYKLRKEAAVAFALNDEQPRRVLLTGGLMKKVVIDGESPRHGRNVVRFDRATPGTMYRLVFRYRKFGTEVPAEADGIRVRRRFYLLGRKGRRIREIKSGDAVPRGSYVESVVTASLAGGGGMRYCLVTNNKPAGAEIVPASDSRFNQSSTAYVLREDATAAVLYHHEQTPSSLTDRCVLHAELAGDFVVPPAEVELMYQPDVRGHSGTARIKVSDEMEKTN